MTKFYLSIVLFIALSSHFIYSQSNVVDTSEAKPYNRKDDFSIAGFPIAFFLPETSLGFGLTGLMVFNAGKEKAWRKSQINIGAAYTLKNQFLLFVPYEFYFKQKWKLNGEVGAYKYFFNYFGIGRDSEKKDEELYDVTFPRLLSTLSYRLKPNFLVGFQYRFDAFNITGIDSLLMVNKPVGADGGIVSSYGLSLSYDSRDDIFYPRKGVFTTFTAETSGDHSFATYKYALSQLEASYYQTIFKNHVLVGNITSINTAGSPPFFVYPYVSSTKRARGFADRRFIDRNVFVTQAEYRFPIYKRLRGDVFGAVSSIGSTFNQVFLSKALFSYGAGLRFQLSKKQMSHVRLDVAHTNEGFQFYFTIGEAF